MLGEGEKFFFRLDDHYFFALGLLFVLTCEPMFLSLFLLRARVELVGSASGKIYALKKPGVRKKMHSVLRYFFCANVHFEAKPSEMVVEEGD